VRPVPQRAIDELERFEGKHDGDRSTPDVWEPAPDPVGNYTVGFGYCLFENGEPVRDRERAMQIWRERWPNGFGYLEAKALLVAVAQDVCDRILRLLPGLELNDNELSALICLAYNIGVGEEGGRPDFADSTVRRRLLAGDRAGAAEAFLMWVKAGGKTIHGLELRRERERVLFLKPMPAIAPAPEPAPAPAAPPAQPPPIVVDTQHPAKSRGVWSGWLASAIPVVTLILPPLLEHYAHMDSDAALQATGAIVAMLGGLAGNLGLTGRSNPNIKPLR